MADEVAGEEIPAFEIHFKDKDDVATGEVISIFRNGRVVGLDKPAFVINRIYEASE